MDSKSPQPAPVAPERDIEQQTDRTQPPSEPSEQPFRFLNLPKDIRLMVYDLLPLTTHHHSITFGHEDGKYALTVVSRQLPGICILATCKEIYSEATSIRGRAAEAQAAPVQLVTHWRGIDIPAMRGILHCAANMEPCACNNGLEIVLAKIAKAEGIEVWESDAKVVDESAVVTDNIQPRPKSPRATADIMFGLPDRSDPVYCSDITSHSQLHALLCRNHAPGSRRIIELAILCPMNIKLPKLRSDCGHFYNWLKDMHRAWEGDSAMHIKLRPRPETETAKVKLEVDYAFWDAENPPSKSKGRKWSYELGDWLEREEWEESWRASGFALT